MDKLTNTVRKARRVGIANKIEGIKTIREAYPEHDLFAAKYFFELITGDWDHIAALNMTALWCVKHWEDRVNCGCSLGEPQVQATAHGGSMAAMYEQWVQDDRTAVESLTSGTLMQATDMIRKIDAEKTAVKNAAATTSSWYVPGGIFPDQTTADYWQAESKRDPLWHRRLLAAAGVL